LTKVGVRQLGQSNNGFNSLLTKSGYLGASYVNLQTAVYGKVFSNETTEARMASATHGTRTTKEQDCICHQAAR